MIIDLTGKRFGKLTVLFLDEERTKLAKGRKSFWICKCDCGNEKSINSSSLKSKDNPTLSCGCIRHPNIIGERRGKLVVIEFHSGSRESPPYYECVCDCGNTINLEIDWLKKYNSCGCMKGKKKSISYLDSHLNKTFKEYNNGAKNRGLSFSIGLERFKELIQQPCFYCGKTDNRVSRRQNKEVFKINGLDRTDNSLGYSEENVVPCCRKCNFLKNKFSKEEFLSWIEQIYNRVIKKENK